jgi:hypothetical protein
LIERTLASSRLRFIGSAAVGVSLGACAAISGLNQYSTTDCADGCDGGSADDRTTSPEARVSGADATDETQATDGTPANDAGCTNGLSRCNAGCVDTTSDTSNCGACGTTCSASDASVQPACVNSACTFTCSTGFVLCNGTCVALAAGCSTSIPTAYACAMGGCNAASASCTGSGQGCHCVRDSQCSSGKCVKITGRNDLSCGANCSGSGAADDFDCELASPGIPASPTVTGFGYVPSNFIPTSYTPPSSPTTINCNTTYSSSTHSFTGWCSGQTQPTIASNVAQAGGPNLDILAFSNLTLDAGSTLTLTGNNAIVLTVYGDATLSGTIHADGATGTSNSTTAGASGPGGNYSCGSSAGASQGNDGHCSAGAGAGASAAGGAGPGGVGGNTRAGGAARANASLKPLYGGCPGGASGSWACQTSGGGGGGAVQVSAAGALSVSGSITANGGNGGTSTCFAGGCGANGYGGGGGGAGSGGAILLEGQTVSAALSNTTVNGGNGGAPNTTGGGGAGPGGTGGTGGTSASAAGGSGTGSTSDGCGSYTQCGGGGGGSYGYLTVHTGSPAPTYSCRTTLAPAPVPSTGHTACLCVADSNCSSGKCVNANSQCTGSCTGSGVADSADCQSLMSATTAWTCTKGNCDNVTSPTGTCTASGIPCWCTADSQCPNGKCVPWAGCGSGACTGSGIGDGFHCAP